MGAKASDIPAKAMVAQVGELPPGATKKFKVRRGEFDREALLVNHEGELYAYLNRCPHAGIPLDWMDNKFFSVDRRYLMCANHGAVFEPTTGECIWGPCAGVGLQKLELEIEGEQIFAHFPREESE